MNIKNFGTQKEQEAKQDFEPRPCRLLDISVEYDSTNPEETIREFIKDIRGMISRYETNNVRITEIENELQDLEHYAEVGNFKNVPEGYRMYRKLAELRRERRACKNEIDLLWPVYEYFHATEVLNRLAHLQGDCGKVRETINGRMYTVRSNVLDEWLEEKPEIPEETEIPEQAIHNPAGQDKPCMFRTPKIYTYNDIKYEKVWERKEGETQKCTEAK